MSRLRSRRPFPLLYLLLLSATALMPAAESADVIIETNVMIPMRDGTKLAANIFRPKGEGRFPAILMRTPYGRGASTHAGGLSYAEKGYAMVIQDCRGRGDSEGPWDPFRHEGDDGFDTQEWVGRQPWCNGSIGTAGGSYVGWTQWAAAPKGSRFLKAMVPVVPFCNAYDLAYDGGAFQLSLLMGWGAAVGGVRMAPDKLATAFRFLPLNRFDDQLDRKVPYLADWINHPVYDDYWKQRGIGRQSFDDITVPILNIGGWYDIFSKATLDMINGVRHESRSRPMRRNQFVVIGPWPHGIGRQKTGELDFGQDARLNPGDLQLKWFDYWLRDRDTGVEDWPALRIFVMGENRWRDEREWPLARTSFTPWYLDSHGHANDPDGTLSPKPPGDGNNDRYVYDPANPVPTHGGNNLMGAPAGPFDQSELEERDDILVYTSMVLTEALEVTGPVKVVLFAASTARDTDFTAKLVDVHPDGRAYNLCDGIIRARWRNSRTLEELLTPGVVSRFEIDLWVTSNVFLPGHRIRVEISSSNFPRFDRNPNTGNRFGSDTRTLPATQTIVHDSEHASHILLPVIPR